MFCRRQSGDLGRGGFRREGIRRLIGHLGQGCGDVSGDAVWCVIARTSRCVSKHGARSGVRRMSSSRTCSIRDRSGACRPCDRSVAGASDRGVDAVGISSFFAEQEVGVPAEVLLLGCSSTP